MPRSSDFFCRTLTCFSHCEVASFVVDRRWHNGRFSTLLGSIPTFIHHVSMQSAMIIDPVMPRSSPTMPVFLSTRKESYRRIMSEGAE